MKIRKIDKLLTEIFNTKNYQFVTFRKSEDEIEYRKEINYLLEELKLIRKPFTNNSILELTQFGNEVMDKGGWIQYSIEKKKIDNELYKRKIEFEKAELENLNSNTDLNKWLLKTKWFPHIISLISMVIAIVFGYLTIVSDNNNSKLENDLKEVKLKIEKVNQIPKNNKQIQRSEKDVKIKKDTLNK